MIKKIACVGIVLLLSGCSAVIDWGKKSFKQGETIEIDKEPVTKYIRAESVYDQFDMHARFVALWLNDEVRTAYAKLHGRVRGSSPLQDEMLIKRQLDENKSFITFYVLTLAETTLGELESEWHLFLTINDSTVIIPTDIKQVDLPNEYKFFFGKHFTRFKIAYRVLFDAQDLEDQCVIDASTQTLSLMIRCINREVVLKWQIPSALLHCTPEQLAELKETPMQPIPEPEVGVAKPGLPDQQPNLQGIP